MEQNQTSVLLNLPKDILLSIIEKLSSEVDLLKSRLAESEERNHILQHKLPDVISRTITSAIEVKTASSRSSASCTSETRESLSENAVFTSNSDFLSNTNFPIITSSNYGSIEPKLNGSTGASPLSSNMILNLLSSLIKPNAPISPSAHVASRRRRKILRQLNQIPSARDSPVPTENTLQKIEEPILAIPYCEFKESTDVFLPGSMDPPSEQECVSDNNSLTEETLIISPQLFKDPTQSSNLGSDSIMESILNSTITEDSELGEEAFQEIDKQINSSLSSRKNRYWQTYLVSNEWTRATCALMSCLFTRQQMAHSTVLGRQCGSGEVRDRLPIRLVHYIVTSISRRFMVPPSKVRARMAQKCKDARRVARKTSEDDDLSDVSSFSFTALPSYSN